MPQRDPTRLKRDLLRLCILGCLPIGVTAGVFASVILGTDLYELRRQGRFGLWAWIAVVAAVAAVAHAIAEAWNKARLWSWAVFFASMVASIWNARTLTALTPDMAFVVPAVLAVFTLSVARLIRVFEARLAHAPVAVPALAAFLSWSWLFGLLIVGWIAL